MKVFQIAAKIVGTIAVESSLLLIIGMMAALGVAIFGDIWGF